MHDSSIYRGRRRRPSVPVFLEGQRVRQPPEIGIAGRESWWPGGDYGDIRVYDLKTRQLVGEFYTGPGRCLNMGMHGRRRRLGDQRLASGALAPDRGPDRRRQGTPASQSPSPRDPPHRLTGQRRRRRRLSETRLVVVKYADGAHLPDRPRPAGAAGADDHPDHRRDRAAGRPMILDGKRLVVPDENGLSVVELDDDAASGTVVTRCATPRSATRPPWRGSATATSSSTRRGTCPRPTRSRACPRPVIG